MNSSELYNQYKTKMQKIADVKYASAVLQWDQETYLPPKGNDGRGRQIATLNEIAHEKFTTTAIGNLLTELLSKDNLTPSQKRNVQLSFEDYLKANKLSAAFVRTLSETINKSFHAWVLARKKNSFKIFEQPLAKLIELKKQEADLLGYQNHPYNALMNDFDKGLTVEIVDNIFEELKPQLTILLTAIKNKPQIIDSFLHQHFDKGNQWKLGIEILKKMHFDFEAGRQDISEHPFTTNFNSADVRITTRIDENDFSNMLWSCIHEGGHALYEQGLPNNQYGMPLGEYCSLSIHESQSRFWENNIGKGLPFWQANFELVRLLFNTQFNNISTEQFYAAINKVMPSPIRTEADELTYHFHIIIRYEIEKELINGNIVAKDIPTFWNDLYKKYLGIIIADDKTGCLQDVHWSHGSFGYFATYSLGSLYAAQLYAAICDIKASIEKEIAKGNYRFILQWLTKNIFKYGRYFSSQELCKNATGEMLNPSHFINYANAKYKHIYNL